MFFTELNEFGWNWLTLSSTVLVILTAWQYRAFVRQATLVWEKQSAESVSITAIASVFFITAASLYYGLSTQSFVISFTGGLSVPILFLLRGLWKFGEPTRRDGTIIKLGVAGLFAFLLPVNPAWIFAAFAVATTVPLLAQLLELYNTGTRGVVNGELLATYTTKNAFLTIFAYAANEPVYMALTPVWLALSVWLMVKWFICKPSLQQPATAPPDRP